MRVTLETQIEDVVDRKYKKGLEIRLKADQLVELLTFCDSLNTDKSPIINEEVLKSYWESFDSSIRKMDISPTSKWISGYRQDVSKSFSLRTLLSLINFVLFSMKGSISSNKFRDQDSLAYIGLKIQNSIINALVECIPK